MAYINAKMEWIESVVVPQIPKRVKAKGNPIMEPFKLDGSCKKIVTDWVPEGEGVVGPFTRIYFEDVNLGSDAQVKEYLLSQGWKPSWWNVSAKTGDRTSPKLTNDGRLCPNLESMETGIAADIVLYLKLKHRKGLLEGLLKVVRPDGAISGEANTIGAATHRMTHRKIVNIPGNEAFLGRQIRRLFIAREGYVIVGCDSKSNQLRMLAHYMGDEEYADAVVNSDIHSYNQKKAKLETRSQAKTFIYAFLFGAGDSKIGKIVNGTAKDGRRLKDTFLSSLPKLNTLVNRIQRAVNSRGFFYGLDGRKIYCDSSHKALNYLLQGAEAVYMKYAAAFLWKWMREERLDAHFLAMIHDEFQLEVREDQAERVAFLANKAMEVAGKHLKLRVPMEGDPKIGKHWGQTH